MPPVMHKMDICGIHGNINDIHLWSQTDIRYTIQCYCEEFVEAYTTSTPVNDLCIEQFSGHR